MVFFILFKINCSALKFKLSLLLLFLNKSANPKKGGLPVKSEKQATLQANCRLYGQTVDGKVKIYEGTTIQQEGIWQKDYAIFDDSEDINLRRNGSLLTKLDY